MSKGRQGTHLLRAQEGESKLIPDVELFKGKSHCSLKCLQQTKGKDVHSQTVCVDRVKIQLPHFILLQQPYSLMNSSTKFK